MALTDTQGKPLPSGERTVADAEAHSPGLLHDSDLPRASERTSPITRAIISALAIGLGIAAICWGLFGTILNSSIDDRNDTLAAIVTIIGGVCFTICGFFIWRDRLLPTLIFAVAGVAAGVISTVVM